LQTAEPRDFVMPDEFRRPMMKSPVAAKALMICLVAANVAVAYAIADVGGPVRPDPRDALFAGLRETHRTADSSHRAVLVTFQRFRNEPQLASLRDAVAPFLSKGLAWFVITADPSVTTNLLDPEGRVGLVVLHDRERLEDHFGSAARWQTWLLFDSNRVPRRRGFLNAAAGGGLGGALRVVLDDDLPYGKKAVQERLSEAIGQNGFASQRRLAGTAGEQRHMTVLLNTAAGCNLAATLRIMNDLSQNDASAFSIVVPSNWSNQDTESLAAQLNLRLPVSRADPSVMAAWRDLGERFGLETANGIVVIVGESGVQDVIVSPQAAYEFAQRLSPREGVSK
jgi:hypothetical protein